MTFLAIGLLSLISQSSCDLRMTCQDAKTLQAAYQPSFLKVLEHLERLKELALLASNGAVGAEQRGFINNEREATVEEISRILNQTQYQDVFGANYLPMRNGIDFILAYPSAITSGYLVGNFSFPKLSTLNLGKLAKQRFQPVFGRTPLMKINDILITPNAQADTYSYSGREYSALAWAGRINELSNRTHVSAAVEETVLALKVGTTTPFATRFHLNGVVITGQVSDVNTFIYVLNNYATLTGVKARLKSGKTDEVELYATDARNISINLREDRALIEYLRNRFAGNTNYNAIAGVVLTSKDEFELRDAFDIAGKFVEPNKYGLREISLATQEGAQEGLESLYAALTEMNQVHQELNRLATACP